jgi:hypothetical protein
MAFDIPKTILAFVAAAFDGTAVQMLSRDGLR